MSEQRQCLYCQRMFRASPQQSQKKYCNSNCQVAAYAAQKPKRPPKEKPKRRKLNKKERAHLIALLAYSSRKKIAAHLGVSPSVLIYAAEGVGQSAVEHIKKIMACTLDEVPRKETRQEVRQKIEATRARAIPLVPEEHIIWPSDVEHTARRYSRDEFEY